ncbi:MAG TPA: hypothetical protein VM913_03990 [Sphingomicrobium sp.]|jgi:deferrochelatase/peroxidase EfeB|nr:hypothetical protein [Sphingomicrobium sp.]
MDEGPVSDYAKLNWKLADPIDAQTQAIVISGFGGLGTGRALFLQVSNSGGDWLTALRKVAPISTAEPPTEAEAKRSAAIAFTWSGLQAMGLDARALASFSDPFREGMLQEDRLRRLGDRRKDEWQKTVVDGGPKWSGNCMAGRPVERAEGTAFAVRDPDKHEETLRTELTVHVLLLLYAIDDAEADAWRKDVEQVLAKFGVRTAHHLPLMVDPNGIGISSEHFGFADGLSQPVPFDADPKAKRKMVTANGSPVPADPIHGVPLGEILFGYTNGHNEPAPGPVVPADDRGRPQAAKLEPHPEGEGFFDFGRNGSYLVARELLQDVAAFWCSMDANAKHIREQDPSATQVTSYWLAERVVGRNRDGHLLCPKPMNLLNPLAGGGPDSNYRFYKSDRHGTGCPPGSHVRRANPRDALSPFPDEGALKAAMKSANNHRILRRGRKFGPKIEDERKDDNVPRGLLFMCLNTDIARQFEFVQQTWLMNSNFATLLDETDPLIGPPGRMTIREEPLRRTIEVDTFVKFAGGEYFFLPSLPALAYLEAL